MVTAVARAEQTRSGPTVPSPMRTDISSAGGPWSMSTATTDSHTAFRTTSSRSPGGTKAVSSTGLTVPPPARSEDPADPAPPRPYSHPPPDTTARDTGPARGGHPPMR